MYIPQNISLPKAIIFDWDNTLTDSSPVIHQAINDTLEYYNLKTRSYEESMLDVGKAMQETFPRLFGDQWQEAGEFYRNQYLHHRKKYFKTLENSSNFLNLMYNYSIYLVIVSNKIGDYLRQEVELLGWNKYFKKIIGSGDAEENKPSPLPVYKALENSNILPKESWFIGDSSVDLECAHNAGCFPVLIGKIPSNLPEQFTPKISVKNYNELISLVEKLF